MTDKKKREEQQDVLVESLNLRNNTNEEPTEEATENTINRDELLNRIRAELVKSMEDAAADSIMGLLRESNMEATAIYNAQSPEDFDEIEGLGRGRAKHVIAATQAIQIRNDKQDDREQLLTKLEALMSSENIINTSRVIQSLRKTQYDRNELMNLTEEQLAEIKFLGDKTVPKIKRILEEIQREDMTGSSNRVMVLSDRNRTAIAISLVAIFLVIIGLAFASTVQMTPSEPVLGEPATATMVPSQEPQATSTQLPPTATEIVYDCEGTYDGVRYRLYYGSSYSRIVGDNMSLMVICEETGTEFVYHSTMPIVATMQPTSRVDAQMTQASENLTQQAPTAMALQQSEDPTPTQEIWPSEPTLGFRPPEESTPAPQATIGFSRPNS